MIAELSATTVLLIAAPVAGAVFLLVLVLYASSRSRSPVALRLEREAARRDRARRRAEARALEEEPEPVLVAAGHGHAEAEMEAAAGPGTSLAVPVATPPASVRAALVEAQRARLVAPPLPARDPEKAELDRRQFINRGIVGGTTIGLGIFGVASLAFMYPKGSKGFGGKVNSGVSPETAIAYLKDNGKPIYSGEGRFYIVPLVYKDEAEARKTYPLTFDDSKAAGIVVLYQKCAHLGCRVPWCDSSQWFECPCHGSQYNLLGERQRGPAPRGLSRFPFTINAAGEVVVDSGKPIDAPPRGPNTPGLPDPPDHCVAG